MDRELELSRELLEFKEFRNSGWKLCNTAKQISTGLEMDTKLKSCHSQWEKSLFFYEAFAEPNINKEKENKF